MFNLRSYFLHDYVYKQDADGSYQFDEHSRDFVLCDKNVYVKTVLGAINACYQNILTHNGITPHSINCDVVLLDQALEKYSRDVYGEARLAARVGHLDKLDENDKRYLLQVADYGMKVDSLSPYIHRQLAVLLYWLSTLKPFSSKLPNNITVEVKRKLGFALEFHNEFVSYIMVLAGLRIFGLTLTIHSNQDLFADFLYDLHYRRLSRSSLEFFLGEYIR